MSDYEVSQIHVCRNCGSAHLQPYLTLPPMPLTDAFRKADQAGDDFMHPIMIFLCEECGLSQILHNVSVNKYYEDYRYTSAASKFFQTFMQNLATEVWRRWDLATGDPVIEIGSGDGAQLKCFQELGARVLGFEPSAVLTELSRQAGVPALKQLYVPGSETDVPTDMRPARVVLLTYTFDHLPEPTAFAKTVLPVLDPDRGLLVIEVHDLQKILDRHEFCLFEHEHSVYCTAGTLQAMLDRAGYALVEVGLVPEAQRRANSLLVVATPKGSRFAVQALPPLDRGPYSDLESCRQFGREIEVSIAKLQAYVADRRAKGLRVAGYGAGGRGVMTLAAMARPGEIAYVCDQNPSFHGYLTPGARVPVVSAARLTEDLVDEVVVFSFGYFQEIWDSLADFRAKGGKVISLLDLL